MTWVDSSRAWIKLVHAAWSMAKPRPHQPGLAENPSIRSRHVHARGRQLHQARARLHVPAHEAPRWTVHGSDANHESVNPPRFTRHFLTIYGVSQHPFVGSSPAKCSQVLSPSPSISRSKGKCLLMREPSSGYAESIRSTASYSQHCQGSTICNKWGISPPQARFQPPCKAASSLEPYQLRCAWNSRKYSLMVSTKIRAFVRPRLYSP